MPAVKLLLEQGDGRRRTVTVPHARELAAALTRKPSARKRRR
jgi:hypothetical protein